MNIQKVIQNFFAPYRPNKSRTVRFAFPLLFAVSALLGAAVIDSENQSYIHIEISDSTVKEGEVFSIDVYVSAHTPINAVDLAVDFPKDQVEVTGIDVGQSVITIWTVEPYVEDNTVILKGGTFRKGFKGDHLIATVKARAKTSGLATFEVSEILLLAGDGSGSEVEVSSSGEETTQLYIANEDGTFSTGGVGAAGQVSVRIITDIDGDGSVTLGDVSRFMVAWSSKTTIFDFNGDSRMTFRDFGILLADVFNK